MKRTLAIFTALGVFAGIASAQSSVTMYGLVDLNYQYMKSGSNSPLGGNHLHRLADGTTYGPGSRLGFQAQEDLGDGLNATAVLEMGITADTGASANGGRAFGRQAYVSLASPRVGEVRLGRQYALHDEVMRLSNPFSNTTLLHPGAAANTFSTGAVPLFIDAPRIDNVVQYLTPTFNGLTLAASVAPGEGLVDRYQGVKGLYAKGPVNAAVSYEWSKARVGTAGVSAAGDTVNKILMVGANYNFGTFRLFGGYQSGRNLTAGSSGIITGPAAAGGIGTQIASLALPGLTGPATRLTGYTVAASVPIGVTTLATNYTRSKYENAAGDSRTLARLAVVGSYAFSKTTIGYGGVAFHSGDLKDFMNEKTIFQLGLRRAF
jgi:GBP family porin